MYTEVPSKQYLLMIDLIRKKTFDRGSVSVCLLKKYATCGDGYFWTGLNLTSICFCLSVEFNCVMKLLKRNIFCLENWKKCSVREEGLRFVPQMKSDKMH